MNNEVFHTKSGLSLYLPFRVGSAQYRHYDLALNTFIVHATDHR